MLGASRDRNEVGDILNMCFLQSLKEKNELLQCLKETMIQFTGNYWCPTVIKTTKDLS